MIERYITSVGVVTLREDNDAAGGGKRNIDKIAVDCDSEFADSRRKESALRLVSDAVCHDAKVALHHRHGKDREIAVNPEGQPLSDGLEKSFLQMVGDEVRRVGVDASRDVF